MKISLQNICRRRLSFSVRFTVIFPVIIIILLLPAGGRSQDLLRYVQPLSGTAPSTTAAALKHSEAGSEKNANTIPAVGTPFGMTQWTAQTRLTEKKCIPPYFYKDSLLTGFRGTHWLSGSCTQDYGSFAIMPITGKLKTVVKDCATPFSHQQEIATPAYYKLELPAYQVSVEITATERCGIMQITMLRDDSLYLLIMPNSDQGKGFVQLDHNGKAVSGYNPVHRIYQGWGEPAGFAGNFYLESDKAAKTNGVFDVGAYLGYYLKKGEQLRIRIGTSFTGIKGALKNLQKEIPLWDFDAVRAEAERKWGKALQQITIETGNEKHKRIFYTALYHAMQHPRLFSDADGKYPSFAGNTQLKKMPDGNYYDDFSMWDTYRAQLPLLEILDPSLVNSLVRSLIAKGQQGGWLPIFPCWNSYTAAMIGDHAAAFISAAFAKGIRDYDVEEAYRLMRQNAFNVPSPADYKNGKGRRAINSYLRYGYIPMEDSVPDAWHKKEQVSRTLEYAYDDYALSLVAKALSKTEDYSLLQKRLQNYKNVFDAGVNMVRGKHADGSWYKSFNADIREPYITEGTPRQYTFYVPHDIKGLAALMGGAKQLENALDSLFAKNEYWHGNEPGHQIPFLYNFTSSPFKTQEAVRRILEEEYSDGPGGLSGNDDAGQMSAWYVFAAMGFYPVNPASGEYQLCSPLFDRVVIRLDKNKKFEIKCRRSTDKANLIRGVLLNGMPVTTNTIRYEDIRNGGLLEIELY
jgi:predicted alpha-1,2-mannosidase